MVKRREYGRHGKNAKLFDEPIRNVKGKLFLWDYEYNEAEM